MIDHDPGDEDREPLPLNVTCPFCGQELNWRDSMCVPVIDPCWEEHRLSVALEHPLSNARAYHEVLRVCSRCKPTADRFSRAHRMSFGERQYHRDLRTFNRLVLEEAHRIKK